MKSQISTEDRARISMGEGLIKIVFTIVGLMFLILAKSKNRLYGYTTPKPIRASRYDQCVNYDMQVVSEWLDLLQLYTGERPDLAGKSILELGPGSDLGTGLLLLGKGADKYAAIDVNNLVADAPTELYELIFERIGSMSTSVAEPEYLEEQLSLAMTDRPEKLQFVCREDFDIAAAFKDSTFDIVFSQAAFEHFDNIRSTLRQLTTVTKPGSKLVAVIDLQTHSRWIRDKDPNNIYRYPKVLYNALCFRSSPNRVRPNVYEEILQSLGWINITVRPLATLDLPHNKIAYQVHSDFRAQSNRMNILSFALFATKE